MQHSASFEASDTVGHYASQLAQCYRAKQDDIFDEIVERLIAINPHDRLIAAVVAFAASQRRIANRYPFCPDPFDMIFLSDVARHVSDSSELLARVRTAVREAEHVESPSKQSIENGKQSAESVFQTLDETVPEFAAIIGAEIVRYRARFQDSTSGLITSWPDDSFLDGWSIRMREGGRHVPHIHPKGWISGIVYVDVPDPETDAGGQLEFDLNGFDLPLRHQDKTSRTITPQPGMIVLFPSSLFHGTTALRAPTERIAVSFDLVPRMRTNQTN